MLTTKFSPKFRSQLVAAGVSIIVLILLSMLFRLQEQKYQNEELFESAAYGNLLCTQVERELNSLLFISNGMTSYITVYKDELNPTKVKLILADLWHRAKHVRSLGVAVGYTFSYVYPEKNNLSIIGKDLRNIPDQWPRVKLAIETSQGVFDGPVDLIQGGSDLIYRYPIFIENKYWGMVSTVIDTKSFFKAAFANALRKDYEFSIRRLSDKRSIYGNPQLFNQKSIYTQISYVPNGQWEWAIKKRNTQKHNELYVLGAMGILLGLFSGAIVYFFMRERYQLAEEALLDNLTGLPNRRLLEDRLQHAYSDAKRSHKIFGLMAIDIDYFKQINDTYGHDFGDEVIKHVSATIRMTLRDIDTVARIGGDEFIVIVRESQSKLSLRAVAQKLKDCFAYPVQIMGRDIEIHFSIGIAVFSPMRGITLKQLLKQADIALYQSKASGRNTFSFYEEG